MSKFPKIYVAFVICANFSNVNAMMHSIQSETCNLDLQYSFPFEYLDQNCAESRFEQVNDRRFEDYNEIIAQFDQNALDIALNARTAMYLMEKNKSLDSETEQEASEIFNTFEYSAFTYVLTSFEILEQMDSAHTVDKQIIEKPKHNNHLIEAKLKHISEILEQMDSAHIEAKLKHISEILEQMDSAHIEAKLKRISEILEQMDSAHTVDKQIIEKLKHNNHLIETKLQHVRDLLQQLYSATANSKLAGKSTFVD